MYRSASESKADLEKIPIDDPDAALKQLEKLAENAPKREFKQLFRVLKKINLEAVPEELVTKTLDKFVHLLEKAEQANELFRFAESRVARTALCRIFMESEFFADIWMPRLERGSDDVPFLIKQISEAIEVEIPHRLLRKAMFRLCAARQEVELCYKILKSVSLSDKSYESFLEFCGHATAMLPLIVSNGGIAGKLFNRIMDMACVLNGWKRVWMIKFAKDMAPLVRGKTVHGAVLDFVQYMEKPASLVRDFELASGSLYNKEMGFLNASPVTRPYHLYKKWHVDPTKIAEMQSPVDVYNTILRFCKEDWERAANVLSVLPIDSAIVFYYVMIHSGHEGEFHKAIEKAFSNKQEQLRVFALTMLEHCGRTLPGLVTPHLKSIEKMGLKKAAGVVAELVKADVVDFRKLWKHVQRKKFESVKCVIREGITQVQRRSKSIENTNFVLAVLNHYFRDTRGSINWSRVAHEFHDDVSIVQTILLPETTTDSSTGRQQMMRWRAWFMGYVNRSPAELHRALAVPYLLLVSGEQNLPVEKVKWAASYLPAGRTTCECIIEAFAVFELTRHVLAQAEGSESMEMLKVLFGFDLSSASTYTSMFVHAGVAASARSATSLNLLLDAASTNNGLYAQAANVALNILRLHSDMCNFEELKGFQKNELVDVVLSFLTLTVRDVPAVSISEGEQEILDILQSTRLFTDQDLDSELKHHVFKSYRQVHNHMLKLAVSCFLLLPSRSVPQSSLDKCMSLLVNPRSDLEEKIFALRALAQVPVVPEFDFMSLASVPELHNALLAYASGQNRMDLIAAVLEKSNDYLVLKAIKRLLAFIDGEIINRFIKKTAPATSTEVLFSTIDIFGNKQQLLLVFSEIRQRPLLPIFVAKQHQQLMTALAKFSTADFSESIAKQFDDFALLCTLCRKWEGRKRSAICSSLTEASTTVTLPCLFQYALSDADGIKDTISSFLALAEAQHQTDRRVLAYIATFMLASASSEPFLTISHHFQTNPEDITPELVESLIPALFVASELPASQFRYMNRRADALQREIVDCLRLTVK